MIDLSVIVLAAGRSQRMGGENKLLLPFGEKTVLETVLDAVTALPFREIILVSGHDHQRLSERTKPYPINLCYNSEFASGMSTSLKMGISAADPNSAGFLICLADMPMITSELLTLLCRIFTGAPAPSIVVPVCRERRGNPVIFSQKFRQALLEIDGDKGARSVIQQHPQFVIEAPVDDPAVLSDVDSLSQYRNLRELSEGRNK